MKELVTAIETNMKHPAASQCIRSVCLGDCSMAVAFVVVTVIVESVVSGAPEAVIVAGLN